MTEPLVSIIIPTRNRRHFLEVALDSVRGQTWDAWEVWVIDDASSTVQRREVQLSKLVSGGYVISEGLAPGEVIVTAGEVFPLEVTMTVIASEPTRVPLSLTVNVKRR